MAPNLMLLCHTLSPLREAQQEQQNEGLNRDIPGPYSAITYRDVI